MNALSTLGHYFQPQLATPQVLPQSLGSDGQGRASLQWPTAQGGNPVTLSEIGKALAGQAVGDASSLLQRAADFGSATIDAAKKFVGSFAESLLGDAAKGMTFSFESSSISARSSFSSALQHSEGSNGSRDAAALRLEDVTDFAGTGTITTADGQRFSFEVEVHYESTQQISASSVSSGRSLSAPDFAMNTSSDDDVAGDAAHAGHRSPRTVVREGLAANFPGSASDLIRMFDKGMLQLPFQAQANGHEGEASRSGNLNLRLVELLANPDALAGKLAKSYGDFAAPGKMADQA